MSTRNEASQRRTMGRGGPARASSATIFIDFALRPLRGGGRRSRSQARGRPPGRGPPAMAQAGHSKPISTRTCASGGLTVTKRGLCEKWPRTVYLRGGVVARPSVHRIVRGAGAPSVSRAREGGRSLGVCSCSMRTRRSMRVGCASGGMNRARVGPGPEGRWWRWGHERRARAQRRARGTRGRGSLRRRRARSPLAGRCSWAMRGLRVMGDSPGGAALVDHAEVRSAEEPREAHGGRGTWRGVMKFWARGLTMARCGASARGVLAKSMTMGSLRA